MQNLRYNENADVIFTTYFTSRPNPQPNEAGVYVFAPKDDLSYIYPWYVSVKHLELNAVVLHDELSSEFVEKHQTEKIRFVRYIPQQYSLNDERYIALEQILEHNRFGKVLLTDASDLMVKKNPFEFMSDAGSLYFGTDEDKFPRIRDNSWCLSKLQALNQSGVISLDEAFLDFEYINAGVFGGSYSNVREFNKALTILFKLINNNKNNNMMAINYLLWKFNVNFFKGKPFTSSFKKYESQGDYYIVHK